MSIQTELQRLSDAKTAIHTSIKNKGVNIPTGTKYDLIAPYIDMITGGGTSGGTKPDPDKDFRFYDYDGTLLYSYTRDEIRALPELPQAPSHVGLTFQKWNLTLEELQGLPDGGMIVGALYTTSDGATRLYIKTDNANSPTVLPLYFYQMKDLGVAIDWGDGSSVQRVSGTEYVSASHTYPAGEAEYTITLTPDSDCSLRLGHNSGSYNVFGEVTNYTRAISNVLRGVNIGIRCTTLNSYTFRYCYSLEYITIPDTVTSMGSYAFDHCNSLRCVIMPTRPTNTGTYTFGYCYSLRTVSMAGKVTTIGASSFRYCYSLRNVTLPDSVATLNGYSFSECYALEKMYVPDSVSTMGNYAFNKCYALKSVHLPSGIASIGSNAFYQCYALSRISIPSGVSTMGSSAFYECHALREFTVPSGVTALPSGTFYNCYGMKAYHILPEVPPTLNSSAFNNIPSDCVIYVPAGSVESYLADASWSAHASKITGV